MPLCVPARQGWGVWLGPGSGRPHRGAYLPLLLALAAEVPSGCEITGGVAEAEVDPLVFVMVV